jgi:hypothetical protein
MELSKENEIYIPQITKTKPKSFWNLGHNYSSEYIKEPRYKTKKIDSINGAKDINYENYSFSKIDFSDVTFNNCIFQNCVFNECFNINILIFENCEFISCRFQKCFFVNMAIYHSNFSGVGLVNTKLLNSYLVSNCYESLFFIDDCDISNTIFSKSFNNFDIKFINRNNLTKMNIQTIISDFDYRKEKEEKWHSIINIDYTREQRIYNSFYNFENQYSENKLFTKLSDIRYFKGKAKTRSERIRIKKDIGLLNELFFGYGEKPFRVLVLFSSIVLFNSILFMYSGFDYFKHTVDYNFAFEIPKNSELFLDFLYSIFLSVSSSFNVGINAFITSSIISQILILVNGIVGFILGTIFITLYVKKIFNA